MTSLSAITVAPDSKTSASAKGNFLPICCVNSQGWLRLSNGSTCEQHGNMNFQLHRSFQRFEPGRIHWDGFILPLMVTWSFILSSSPPSPQIFWNKFHRSASIVPPGRLSQCSNITLHGHHQRLSPHHHKPLWLSIFIISNSSLQRSIQLIFKLYIHSWGFLQ